MRKFVKAVSSAMILTMTLGMLSGCGNTPKKVTFDYNADEYIKVGDYKGIEVTLDDYTVTDADLQNVISQICESYVYYEKVDRAAKNGDEVTLDFDAYISGGKVEGFSDSDYGIIIGRNNFVIDGFEEALIGLKEGDSRAITGLKVPDDFAAEPSFAGRAITFNVEILSVSGPVLPEYNEDLVKEASGGEFTTVEEYNKELMRMLEENAATNRYNDKYNQLLDKIVSDTEVIKDLPAEYIETKKTAIQEEVTQFTILYNMSEEDYLQKYYGVSTVEEYAKNQILLEFIFQQIIEKENLTVTEKYYKEHLAQAAEDRGYTSTEKFVERFTEEGVVKAMLLDMAADIILDSAVEK